MAPPLRPIRIVPLLIVFAWTDPAECRLDLGDFGGAHLAYGLGGGVGNEHRGFRHGLDFALMPVFMSERKSGYIEAYEGYALGASGMVGFGDTPVFLGPNLAYGASTVVGMSGGGGPVYRFEKGENPAGYGVSASATLDVMFVLACLRLTILAGGGTTEGIATLALGVGRF